MSSLEIFKKIKYFIFDVDGVLSNGNVLIDKEGNLLRQMNVRDGYAIQLAIKKNYEIIIITGSNASTFIKRLEDLGIKKIYDKVEDKLALLLSLEEINLEQSLYMGDDIPDFYAMKKVALACAPKNACMEIKQIANYISPFNGGEGCARDVIEKVLKLNKEWL